MADDSLHATLDELIIVLKSETRWPKDARRNDAIKSEAHRDPDYVDGWNDGWEACRKEVMKIINEGLGK